MTTLTTLHSFQAAEGSGPKGNLVMDAAGNLFGTTESRGAFGYGTVYELAWTGSGYANTATVLRNFTSGDGSSHSPDLVMDAAGDLFGSTPNGGVGGWGGVYELVKTSTGYAQTNLYDYYQTVDPNGGVPNSENLVMDAAGNLFGTTSMGGVNGAGTIFEIAKTRTGYASTPTVLASFSESTFYAGNTALMIDAAGNLFGTQVSGPNGSGAVFELAKTANGYAGAPAILSDFSAGGLSSSWPSAIEGGLVMDEDGNLFGVTSSGGYYADGTVFEIKKTATGYDSTPITLFSFDSRAVTGNSPFGALAIDASGNLYGTTADGGLYDKGTVFEIVRTATGYAGTVKTLVDFDGSNGNGPWGGLTIEASGRLLGTTLGGGANGLGTIFEIEVTQLQVSIGGTAQEGQSLIATPNQDVSSYQWQVLLNGTWTNIAGATGATYLLQPSDDGFQIRVRVIDSTGVMATSAATSLVLDADGNQLVYGTATNVGIADGHVQYVFGTATNTTVDNGGAQNVYGGGTATGTTLNAGGTQVCWGVATGTTVSGGAQYVWGRATATTLVSGTMGAQYVGAGGAAYDTTIGSGGVEYVFAGGVAHGVTFSGTQGVLGLERSSAFSGTISGWQDTDRIDLGDIAFGNNTSLAYAAKVDNSGGTLTISNGTRTAALSLLGQYTAADFALSDDGHGGTLIANPLAGSQQSLLALPHAA